LVGVGSGGGGGCAVAHCSVVICATALVLCIQNLYCAAPPHSQWLTVAANSQKLIRIGGGQHVVLTAWSMQDRFRAAQAGNMACTGFDSTEQSMNAVQYKTQLCCSLWSRLFIGGNQLPYLIMNTHKSTAAS
jgi:hypothetical protein